MSIKAGDKRQTLHEPTFTDHPENTITYHNALCLSPQNVA